MMSAEQFYRKARRYQRVKFVFNLIRFGIRIAIIIGLISWFTRPLDQFLP